MAVEEMEVMNLITLRDKIHDVLREIILDGSVHITDINGNKNFTVDYVSHRQTAFEKLGVDVKKITPFTRTKVFEKKKYKDLLDNVFDFYSINPKDISNEELHQLGLKDKLKNIQGIYDEIDSMRSEIRDVESDIARIKEVLNVIDNLKAMDLNIEELANLENINFTIGILSYAATRKLKDNYENIKAIAIHTGSTADGEVYLIFYPKNLKPETINFLKSINFKKVYLPGDSEELEKSVEDMKSKLKELEDKHQELINKKQTSKTANYTDVMAFYGTYKLIEKIELLENHLAQSGRFILFNAFVPISAADRLKAAIEKVDPQAIVFFHKEDEIPKNMTIPTKLKNNTIVQPFEEMVKIYSVPYYKEKDPTTFFAITYMIMFAIMFGDVGQGAIFVAAGFYLAKKSKTIAGILKRLGVCSMITGFCYGSVFGMEDLIPCLIARPMENINQTLIFTVIMGIIFTYIAFTIGLLNFGRNKQYKEMLLEKNGIAGLGFYSGFLLILVNQFYLKSKLSVTASSAVTIISVVLMVVSASLMLLKPIIEEKFFKEKSDISMVESGFELFETVLSFFSGTLSFVRVGAFAINHVGLFMAFHALGQMTGSGVMNVFMLILGNIVIIFLEGLIVFIQAIRLEYYELFSKYYKGEGMPYEPVELTKDNH